MAEDFEIPEAPPQTGDLDKLYDIVKGAGLYTKSKDEFKQKYSNPDAINKLYDVTNQAGLYTKSKDDFYSKYYPDIQKKSGGVSGGTSSAQSGSVPQSTENNNLKYTSQEEPIHIQDLLHSPQQNNVQDNVLIKRPLSLKGDVPNVPSDAAVETPLQHKEANTKASEHYKTKAIVNTTKQYFHNNNIPIKESDLAFQEQAAKIDEGLKTGNLTHYVDKFGEDRVGRNIKGVQAAKLNWQKAGEAEELNGKLANGSDKERIDILEGERNDRTQDEYLKPIGTGTLAEVAGQGRQLGRGIIGAAAGSLIGQPELGGFLGMAHHSYTAGYAGELRNRYNENREKGMNPQEALDHAKTQATVGAATSLVTDAALQKMLPTHGSNIGNGFINAVKQDIRQAAPTLVKQSAVAAGAEGAKDLVAKAQGYNEDLSDILGKSFEAFGDNLKLGAVLHAVTTGAVGAFNLSKKTISQGKEMLSRFPKEDVKSALDNGVESGEITPEQAEKTAADLGNYDNVKKAIPPNLSEEKSGVITGLVEKKQNLEKSKETLDKSFHPEIDEQIRAIDEKISKAKNSDTPLNVEVDDLTGETAHKPKLHEELTKQEREGIVVPKEYGYAEVEENGEGENKTYVPKTYEIVKEGGLEKSKPIKIEVDKTFSDKEDAQKIADESLGKHYYDNGMADHEKPLRKESSVTVIKPEDNKPIEATTIAPQEHIPETKKSGVSIILPKHETEIQQPVESEVHPIAEPNKNEQPTEENAIGVSKAETKKQREERGLGDINVQDTRGLKEMFASGKGMVEDGHIDPRSLAKSVAKSPRNLHSDEINALLYDRMRIINEHRRVMNEVLNSIKDGDIIKERELRERANNLEDARVQNEKAVKSGARENALALSTMQNMIKEDYSLASQKAKALIANNGERLPKDVQDRLEKYDKELQEAQSKLELYEERLGQLSAENEVIKAKKEVGEERKKGKAIKKEEIKAERKEIIDRLKAIAKSQAGKLSSNPIPVEMIPVLGKLIRNLVRDSIIELDDIVKHIHDELKEFIDGVTERDVRDSITGYGKAKQLSKNEIEKQVREIKRQGRLVSSIEDVMEGERPKRSGLNREEDSPKVNKLKKELEEEMRNAGMILDKKAIDHEKEFKTKLEAYKKRLQTQLEDYEERIKNNDYAKEEKKPIELDNEGLSLKSKVEEIKAKFESERKRIERENAPGLEKRLNFLTAWRRFVILSNIPTLGKLGAAVAYRSATNFMEEVAGTALKHVPGLDKVAEKAGREGSAINPARELRSLRELASKGTWEDIKKAIKTGSNSLDYAFGGKHTTEPATWLDFFGRVHKALKTPAQRAEYLRAFDIRAKKAAEAGIDMSDNKNQFEVGVQAYEDSLRAIFMQENFVTKGYNRAIDFLEKSGDEGRTLAAFMKVILPIVKVPSNFVAEGTSYAIGGVKAAIALRKGIKNLTPEQSDYVMRALKKQGIGAAVLALGYFSPDLVGGYYTGKRKEGDLKAGDLVLFGIHLPHWMIHAPMLEMLQMGATIRRARDADKGWGEGTFEGGMGLLKQVPFISEPKKLLEASTNLDKIGSYFGDLGKSMVIPPDVQRIAREQDTNDKGEAIIRKPKGLVEHLESGLPVLRKKVPDADQRKKIDEINKKLHGKEFDDLREEMIKEVMKDNQ